VSEQLPDTEQNQEADKTLSKDERTWGMACHLGVFAGFIFPFGNIVVPLVIWLIKSEELPFVKDQGKEALNFQITAFIAFMVCALLMVVGIGFLLAGPLVIYVGIAVIIAAVKANEGVFYRYPLAIRLIK